MNTCKKCNTIITRNRKFCSQSCAASYNNANREPRTVESKRKVSETLKSLIHSGAIKKPTPPNTKKPPYTKLYGLYRCNSCGESFWQRRYLQKCCSIECRDNIRSKNKCVKTQIKFFNIFENSEVILQSNWELVIAKWLTAENIAWHRPKKRIKWFDTTLQKSRTYLPDFYLTKFNYFLDVKNPIKMEQDKDKISQLVKIIPLFVGNIDQVKLFVERQTGLEPACNPLAFS